MQTPARVDFYLLDSTDPAARLHFACRLAEKAWHLNHRVHLQVASPAAAAELDDLLWTFRQGSFVPHEISAEHAVSQSPVTIGCQERPPSGTELLINLTPQAAELPAGPGRIAELIDGSATGRAAGRERFKSYRDRGLTPATHEIHNP